MEEGVPTGEGSSLWVKDEEKSGDPDSTPTFFEKELPLGTPTLPSTLSLTTYSPKRTELYPPSGLARVSYPESVSS